MLGKFPARGGRIDRALQIGALVAQRLEALVEFGQIGGCRSAWRFGIDRADRQFGVRLAFDPQRRHVEAERKIVEHNRVIARGQIERDHARDAGAVGIYGDGVDR